MGNEASKRRNKRRERTREPEAHEGARVFRLQQLIREEMNLLLRGEVRDQRLDGVSITMVELSGDCARLWFTGPEGDGVVEAFEGAAGFFRSRLAESLVLKRTPDLRFRRDPATRAFDERT
jgi:ribosome-binding factor A